MDDANRVEEFYILQQKVEAEQRLKALQQEEANLTERKCNERELITKLEHEKKEIEAEVRGESARACSNYSSTQVQNTC